uniref:Lysm-containing receptor kinase 17 n=1 Tax=Parasponia rigida TaxID=3477 RepID=A0A221I0I1_PARRI|nr:lysm-containing receptor kinase 17 [Parasponia rigida]
MFQGQMGFLIGIFFFIICCSSSTFAQQPYVGEAPTDCYNQHNKSSALGYFCNGVNRSCHTFLTFRAVPPYTTVAAISKLLAADPSQISEANLKRTTFGVNKLVIVPITCSCSGQGYYQSNASYVIKADDTYLAIANNTFQGLTTCQALSNQSGNPDPMELETKEKITIPLRCACPTKNQSDLGVNYLMSYLTDYDDDDSTISEDFGVDNGLLLRANQLTETENTIYPSTTILVPLQSPPTNFSTILRPPPSPPAPPRSSTPAFSSSNTSSNKNWLYALFGAIGGSAFLLVLGAIIYRLLFPTRKNKADPVLVSESSAEREEKKVKSSREPFEDLSDITQSIKVYNFDELQLATNNFSTSSLVKGTVYRGVINGNTVAIKKMEGDVSKEINLLQKINHSSLIRLCGVCFNEGHWYLVYEYAINGALSDWIYDENDKGRYLSWTQKIQIALDVTTGLNYLHSFTTPSHVHWDIRSSNILLDSDFRAKIANFGLVRSTKAQEDHFSLTNHIVGTIGYLAPEYLENGLVSTKLDVYAFGVLLLEMLTGKEVSVLYDEHRLLSDVFSGVLNNEGKESLSHFIDPTMQEMYPSEIVKIVVQVMDRCLKKNPEVRPPMDEVVQLLSKALSSSLIWESSNNIVGVVKLTGSS